MAQLLDCPNELLVMIPHKLPRSRDLYSFIRVNRRLYKNLAREFRLHETIPALYYAAINGDEATVRFLLEKGDVKVYKNCFEHNSHHNPYPHFPPSYRQVYQTPGKPSNQVVRSVLNKSFRLLLQPSESLTGSTPLDALQWASFERNWRTAELAMEKGALIDSLGVDNHSALSRAAWTGDKKMARVLLDHGASLTLQRYLTPLSRCG